MPSGPTVVLGLFGTTKEETDAQVMGMSGSCSYKLVRFQILSFFYQAQLPLETMMDTRV